MITLLMKVKLLTLAISSMLYVVPAWKYRQIIFNFAICGILTLFIKTFKP